MTKTGPFPGATFFKRLCQRPSGRYRRDFDRGENPPSPNLLKKNRRRRRAAGLERRRLLGQDPQPIHVGRRFFALSQHGDARAYSQKVVVKALDEYWRLMAVKSQRK